VIVLVASTYPSKDMPIVSLMSNHLIFPCWWWEVEDIPYGMYPGMVVVGGGGGPGGWGKDCGINDDYK